MSNITLNNNVIVVKSFNNNILLVRDNEKEKILFQKGIGFAKKQGDIIQRGTLVEKIFVIEDEQNRKSFNEILEKVDNKLIAIVEEMLAEITDEFGEDLSENIHIGLTDHLFYAIKRLRNKEEIENPFLIEIETLYSKEFEMATRLSNRIQKEIDIEIPEGEKGFIALHIHSARNNGKLSNTIKYSFLSTSIVELVEDRLNIEINKRSLDYARFLTHIRFAVERVINNEKTVNDLKGVIKRRYKVSYKIAKECGKIICDTLQIKDISEDEIAYIAMHIERFRVSLEK